jgi:hypothetical protein
MPYDDPRSTAGVRAHRIEDCEEVAMRSTHVIRTGLVVLALAGLWGRAAAADSYDLLLNVPPDETLAYRLDSRSEGTYQGSKFLNTVQADVEVRRAAGARSDNLVFTIAFLRVEAFAHNGAERVPQKLGLDGRTVQVEVTMRGRVVKVEPPGDVNDMQKQLLENFANAIFLELPAKPVKVGDTWKIQLANSGGSGIGNYKLTGTATKNSTKIAKLDGQLKVEGTAPPLHGTGHAESEVAIHGGYVVAAKGSVQLQGDGPSIVQTYELALKP